MASLWEMLMGGGQPQAQMPGMSAQPQNPLQRLLDPSFALPMAAGMMGSGGNMQNIGQGFANAAPMMALRRKQEQETAQRNQTVDYLRKNNPELAAMVDAGMPVPEAWGELTRQKFQKPQQPTDDVQEYEYARQNGFQGSFMDYKNSGRGSTQMPSAIQEYEYGQKNPQFLEWQKTNKGRDSTLTTVDKKAIFEAEDVLPAVDGTLAALSRAKELNDKTYTGATAGARGWAGANLPGGSLLFDPKTSQDTLEFNNLMTYESIKTMADTLKGATTDFELNKFVEILADPSTPPDIRGRTIDRMIALSQRKKQIAEARINKLRGGDYYDAPGGGQAAPQGGGTDYKTKYGLD